MSPIILLLLFFSIFLCQWDAFADAELECYSCASEILQSEWQATGLPQHPPISSTDAETKNFAFYDKCGERYLKTTNELPKSACQGGSCIEMLLMTNGVYAIVRGCLSDFYPTDQPPSFGPSECRYNKVNQNTTFWEGEKKPVPVKPVTIGMRLCTPTTAAGVCNDHLAANSIYARGIVGKEGQDVGWGLDNNVDECKLATGGVQCLDCMRVDMEGTCNWDVRKYCTGSWCTKTVGYVNGRWLEVRGCSPINPLNTQGCAKIERKSEFGLLGDTQVPKTMSLEQCFCNVQRCNGAMAMAKMGGQGLILYLAAAILTIVMAIA